MVQSVKRLTSAQVMISQLMSSNPSSGSVLTALSLEPASDFVSPSLSAPPPLALCLSLCVKSKNIRGAWVAQSVGRRTSAQVMISQFMGSSPVLGSALTAQSLEPASDSVSPLSLSLSLPLPPLALCQK